MKKLFSVLLTIALVIAFTVTAFADMDINTGVLGENSEGSTINLNTETGTVGDNQGKIVVNDGTVDLNHKIFNSIYESGLIVTNNGRVKSNGNNDHYGDITTNGTTGVVEKNCGTITNNYGTVDENVHYYANEITNNFGTVTKNADLIQNNVGTVTNNVNGGTVANNIANEQGTGTIGENAGTVTNNNAVINKNAQDGIVTNNYSGRTIPQNYGEVINNAGTVTDNFGTVDNNLEGSEVSNNAGTVSVNAGTVNNNLEKGTVGTNNNTVTNNAGAVDNNNSTVNNNLEKGRIGANNEDAEVTNNAGTISKNAGTVKENLNSGKVEENVGTVTNNAGDVETNIGVITENLKDGSVGTNNGMIYNNKGKVQKNNGIIYETADMLEGQQGINTEKGIIVLLISDDPSQDPSLEEIEQMAAKAGGVVLTHIVTYTKGDAKDVKGDDYYAAMTFDADKNLWSIKLLGLKDAPFTREGYALDGWSETMDGDVDYAFDEEFSSINGAPLKLYPVWRKLPPKTGDNTNQGLWYILLALSGCVLASLMIFRKKQNNR